ncbi:MAG: A24 family peptidase [Rhodomicrobium sp.]
MGFLFQTRLDAMFGSALAAVALAIAIVDIDRFEIPDAASGLMFVLGLGWVLLSAEDGGNTVLGALLRSGTVAGALYTIRATYYSIRGFDGLGLGDVKLAAAGAPWLSWSALPMALLIAVSAAFILIAAQFVTGSRRIEANAAVPLGAFLAPAIWLAWFASTGTV